MGDVQAHLEVRAHDGLGDFEMEGVGAGDRVGVDVGIVGGSDDAVGA